MIADRFIVKEIGEEGVMVYDQQRDRVHFLNPVAFSIWTLLKEKKSLSEVEKAIREKFHPEDEKDVHVDIGMCLKELVKKELISSKDYSRE